jgi:hypothetical protein
MEKEVTHHFGELLDTKETRTAGLNWDELDYPEFHLEDLEAPFTAEEIKKMLFLPYQNRMCQGPTGT